jgi:cytochrome c biogenesis protein CcmG, thiol:disulfide interchange protein DsbE
MRIFALTFFLALLFAGVSGYAQNKDSVLVDKLLDFKVENIDGEEVNFKSLVGKGPLLVNFWALWCEPCKLEMKAFNKLVEKYQDKGVTMVSINTDKVRSLSKVRSYIKTQGYTFPVLLDPDGSLATEKFSMESLPYSLVLRKDGTIFKKHIGFTAGDELTVENEILEMLKQ